MEWVISLVAAAIAGIGTYIGTRETNKTNREIAAENIAVQQRENEIIREREDTAVQRRKQDLISAGLSSTLAAGSSATTSVTSAPQNSYRQEGTPFQKALEKLDLANLAMNIANTKSNIDLNKSYEVKAEADAVKAQTEAETAQLTNSVFMEDFALDKAVKQANVLNITAQADLNRAKEKTELVVGKYQGRLMEAQIDKYVSGAALDYSSIGLNSERIKESAQNVVESIKRTEKMDVEKEKLYYDLAEMEIKMEVTEYNLAVAQATGVKTTDQSPKVSGIDVGHIEALLGNTFNRFTNTKFKIPTKYRHQIGFSGY